VRLRVLDFGGGLFGFVGAVAGGAVAGERELDTSWIYALFADADIRYPTESRKADHGGTSSEAKRQ
jgi:hypothetical protein